MWFTCISYFLLVAIGTFNRKCLIFFSKRIVFVNECFKKHCGKRRNAGYPHLLLFPQSFSTALFSGSWEMEQLQLEAIEDYKLTLSQTSPGFYVSAV